jgi:putative oxygen-independent coproporphyrinogen III oxidase
VFTPAAPGHGEVRSPHPPVALYVHVPFCVSLCPYCDFVVYTGRSARGPAARVRGYLAALAAELDLRAHALDASGVEARPLRSVYLGGGTPSLLPAAEVARLLDHVRDRFGIENGAEVTIEANPGPDERGDLAGFVAAGVTRLSLGAQSMEASELRRLGRRHAPGDILAAIADARRAGIGSISVDVLYDVPGQTEATWRRTLEALLETGVDHVSAYALTLDDPDAEGLTGPLGDHLPTRPGARAWRQRARAGQDDDRAADLYVLADELLGRYGLHWYELSNWARPGRESRHNLAYWRHDAYEALGPGAHAFDGRWRRRWNAARLDGYLAALLPAGLPGAAAASGPLPRLPPGGEERLDPATFAVEGAILGLRLAEGIGPEIVARPAVREAVEWARGHGLVEDGESGRVVLSLRGRLLSNEVFARIA